jgi:hypothetical protein
MNIGGPPAKNLDRGKRPLPQHVTLSLQNAMLSGFSVWLAHNESGMWKRYISMPCKLTSFSYTNSTDLAMSGMKEWMWSLRSRNGRWRVPSDPFSILPHLVNQYGALSNPLHITVRPTSSTLLLPVNIVKFPM